MYLTRYHSLEFTQNFVGHDDVFQWCTLVIQIEE